MSRSSRRGAASLPEAVETHPQRDVVADRPDPELHAEVRALEDASGVAAALIPLALGPGIRTAFPAQDLERHRLGDAEQGEIALDHLRIVALELHARRLVGHGRELGDVEEVGGAQVLVARARPSVALGVTGAQGLR